MSSFTRLIRFKSPEGKIYFADLGLDGSVPSKGSPINAFASLDDLTARKGVTGVSFSELLAPLPYTGLPIYCVGLNYRSHVEEANLFVPSHPPLWIKPAAALSNPMEDIPMNDFCSSSFPDYEGELVFVVSKKCRDLSPEAAASYILGYTVGNDLSCRLYQIKEQQGGQFFFAKAFDNFAPIGPVLVSPEVYANGDGIHLTTRVNGQTLQKAESTDMIWNAAQILSHMSQGTTIPAGTAVMTGTPKGVGAFCKPQRWLKNGDVVEVEISKIGILRNRIVFSNENDKI